MEIKYTELEKQLLELLDNVVFYAGHSSRCAKNWNHNPNLKCDCKMGKATIRANIILNKYGMGYAQNEIDKIWPE